MLLAIYLLFTLGRTLQVAFFSPLSAIPGPAIARLTGNWSLWHQLNGRKFLAVHEAFAEFGGVVRAAPRTVYIADYRLLGAVYQSKLDKVSSVARQLIDGRNEPDLSAPNSQIPAYSGFTTNRGIPNAFSTIEAHVAAAKRRGMLPHYATAALVEWQESFDSHIQQLTTVIENLGRNTSVDVLSLLAHTLIDVSLQPQPSIPSISPADLGPDPGRDHSRLRHQLSSRLRSGQEE